MAFRSSVLLALCFFAAGAAARPGANFHPCKTLFISYTFTSSETFDLPQIAGPHDASPSSSAGRYFAVYRIFRPIRTISSSKVFDLPMRSIRPMIADQRRPAEIAQAEPSFVMGSFQERAKDILVVVAGLLFGVGCGALTGAIMYLVWSLFTSQHGICGCGDEEGEEEESPKKMGYIKIADPVSEKNGHEGH